MSVLFLVGQQHKNTHNTTILTVSAVICRQSVHPTNKDDKQVKTTTSNHTTHNYTGLIMPTWPAITPTHEIQHTLNTTAAHSLQKYQTTRTLARQNK